jgi:hypothetical protein
MPGGLGQGTESLTGVLEATVRDPYRSGPRRQTDQRDHRSQGQHGVGRHPTHFHVRKTSPKGPQLLIRCLLVGREFLHQRDHCVHIGLGNGSDDRTFCLSLLHAKPGPSTVSPQDRLLGGLAILALLVGFRL